MSTSEPLSVESLLQHDRWLRDLAARLARDESEADELVQETWLAALRRPPRDDGGDPRRWLRRVIANVQMQARRGAFRRARRELERGSVAAEASGPPADEVESAIELRQMLLRELRQLDEPLRKVVVMRHLEGRSLKQIATELAVPRDTVKSRLARGLEQLRVRLDRRTGNRATWVAMCIAVVPRPEGLSLTTPFLMSSASKTAVLAVSIAALASLGLFFERPEEPGLLQPVERGTLAAAPHGNAGTPPMEGEVPPGEGRVPAGSEEATASPVRDASVFVGRVVDLQGSPVAGAEVHPVGSLEPRLTTDATGAFTWVLGPAPTTWTAEANGFVPVLTAHAIPKRTRDLLLVLAPRATYAGHVVDESGDPVARADLHLRLDDTWTRSLCIDLAGGSPLSWHASTDVYGAFRFEDVPAIADALLWVDEGGRRSLVQAPGETREDLVLVLHDPLTADERWARIPHVTGVARLHDGTPAAGARFVAGDFAGTANADGLFRVPYSSLDRDTVLRGFLDGLLPVEVRAGADAGRNGWPDTLSVRFEAEAVGTIQGVLLDTRGDPVIDAPVWLTDPMSIGESLQPDLAEALLGENAVSTDQDGSFTLTALPDRTYTVRAFDVRTWTHAQSGLLQAGDHGVRLILPQALPHGLVKGRCVDRDGAPLADVEVRPIWRATYGRSSTEHSFRSTRTDATGEFVLEDHPQGFEAIACEGPNVLPSVVTVTPDVGAALTLVLPRRANLVVRQTTPDKDPSYFTLDDANGRPTELYRFQWLGRGQIEGADITHWGTMNLGSSGVYTVAEGTYLVRVMDGEDESGRAEVELVAGETTEVVID